MGLEPAVQGAIVGALIGLISGQALLLMQRYLRGRGNVHTEIDAWLVRSGLPGVERRTFKVRFFNEKDIGIALWEVHVEFSKGDMRQTLYPLTAETRESIGVLNLPSRIGRSWVMQLDAQGDILSRVKEADKVELVALIPGGEEFREALIPWDA